MRKLWDSYSYAIILVTLSILTSITLVLQSGGAPGNQNFLIVTVAEGDSLWEIADDFSDSHNLSAQDFINWVERKNGIVAEKIYPGDELLIPVEQRQEGHTELASSEIN